MQDNELTTAITMRVSAATPRGQLRQALQEPRSLAYQFGDDLGRLHTPAMVMHGRNDTLVPFQYGQDLSAAQPNAEFVAFEHSDHLLTNDEPQKYREVVQRFIAAHGG
jgi:pimeloyl-ACP methyl ester carboxylesterase